MRVLVCGSREWTDGRMIRETLEPLLGARRGSPHVVIHGAARGADAIAGQIARSCGLAVEEYPADWRGRGRAAGHIRNRQMLDQGRPDIVIAFKDGYDETLSRGGTENMVRIARQAGVRTFVVSHDHERVRAI